MQRLRADCSAAGTAAAQASGGWRYSRPRFTARPDPATPLLRSDAQRARPQPAAAAAIQQGGSKRGTQAQRQHRTHSAHSHSPPATQRKASHWHAGRSARSVGRTARTHSPPLQPSPAAVASQRYCRAHDSVGRTTRTQPQPADVQQPPARWQSRKRRAQRQRHHHHLLREPPSRAGRRPLAHRRSSDSVSVQPGVDAELRSSPWRA
jgi:hypothetical protein